jgi:hypothetical protein
VTIATGGPRSQALRDLLGCVVALGWLDDAVGRVVLEPGAAGQSGLTAGTVEVLAAGLRERMPALEIEVSDQAEVDAIAVLGLGGAIVRVPRRWFEPCFLITVAAVHPDRRWRIGGALQAQAEALSRLNPELPATTVLSEAHRLNAADLAVVCGTHPTAGEWWAASQSAVQLDGALARAAGLDPRELPAIREIARHEVLELWDTEAAVPDLTNLAAGAAGAVLDATRERATAAARRAVEDAGRVSRNLRKVPQALRRRLAARTGGRKSA